MAIPQDHPHRLAIESQLRAWAIPVRSASRHPKGILLVAAEPGDEDYRAFADGWQGIGVILADSSGSVSSDKTGQFVLPLPLRRAELYQCLCAAAGLPDSASTEPQGQPTAAAKTESQLTLLLVEDNQVNQLVASSLLKKLGHRVDHAENGQRALEALQKRRYDLVLMDCQMPVMDGYEATRAIRRNPEWQTLPIIAVTANVMQGDREDCLEAGMNDYITKPYKRDELRAVIDRWAPSAPESQADS
jgi:CheY-like chemotaxis protein